MMLGLKDSVASLRCLKTRVTVGSLNYLNYLNCPELRQSSITFLIVIEMLYVSYFEEQEHLDLVSLTFSLLIQSLTRKFVGKLGKNNRRGFPCT